jgi:endonuclease III
LPEKKTTEPESVPSLTELAGVGAKMAKAAKV